MTRSCRARTATLLWLVCLVTTGAYAQSWQQYSLSWNSSIVGGRYLGTPPRAWQVYREHLPEVEISISLSNTGGDALYFNSGTIGRAIQVRLFSMDDASGELQERAVRVTMRGVLDRDGSGPFITLPDQLIFADGKGNGGVVWIVAATHPDGQPFAPGQYRFEIELRDVRPAIVTGTGEPLPNAALRMWSGVSTGELDLLVTAPSTPGEVATMYVQRGDVAFERRQFDEAVALFRQAVDADPSGGVTALSRLGGTYLTMGRFSDAVPVLERLPIRGPGIFESSLALAYVGANREVDAITLLRRGSRSEAEVVAEIGRLRQVVRERPAR